MLGLVLVSLIFGGLLIGLRKDSSFLPSSLPGYHLLLGQRSYIFNPLDDHPGHSGSPSHPGHHPHCSREPEGETLFSEEAPESAWI